MAAKWGWNGHSPWILGVLELRSEALPREDTENLLPLRNIREWSVKQEARERAATQIADQQRLSAAQPGCTTVTQGKIRHNIQDYWPDLSQQWIWALSKSDCHKWRKPMVLASAWSTQPLKALTDKEQTNTSTRPTGINTWRFIQEPELDGAGQILASLEILLAPAKALTTTKLESTCNGFLRGAAISF